MKYFFIAGERSGDQHAARLIRAVKLRDESALVCGWGGECMRSEGAQILTYYHDISFVGFLEVARNLRYLKQKLKKCQEDIREFAPDIVVLIDYPGFNLRVARFAKSIGIKTSYYISPKIWAWRADRINLIKSYVDQMLVILPFEEKYYHKNGYLATYVGNPSLEQVLDYEMDDALVAKLKKKGRNIAFLPGSRLQEIEPAIHVITKLSNTYDDCHFLVAGVDNVSHTVYQPLTRIDNITLLFGHTYEILKSAEVAVVTSGTASLEAALLDIPQVVVYQTSTFNFLLAKLLVGVKFISLVNLIANKKIVRELIQGDYNPVEIATELEYLMNDEQTKKRISEGYSEIRNLIGSKRASEAAAEAIVALSSP